MLYESFSQPPGFPQRSRVHRWLRLVLLRRSSGRLCSSSVSPGALPDDPQPRRYVWLGGGFRDFSSRDPTVKFGIFFGQCDAAGPDGASGAYETSGGSLGAEKC